MRCSANRCWRCCRAALRLPALGSIGLIGSSAKWTGFRRRLAEQGHEQAAIDRITSPIGLPEITGKEPAVIAVSVAASLLLSLQRHTDARDPERRHVLADDPTDVGDPRTALR